MEKYEVQLPGAEQLTELVVDQIVSSYMHGAEYRDGLKDQIEQRAVEAVASKIDGEASRIVEEYLTATVQPTNAFGEPTGEPVTLRSRIAKQVETFLSEKVDRDGRPSSGYGRETKTRAEWAINKAVEEIAHKELRAAVDAAAKEVRAQVGTAVQKSVAETVKRVLSLP